MALTTIGIRDLKAQLSSYVQEAKAGNIVIITERGQPVAKLTPIRPTIEQRLDELVEVGLLEWSGQRLSPFTPEIATRGDKTVADLLLEDRE
ncbi:MAG: type II toxin-antitoxin system prevent-host-death family antitoxin [Anaerolineae bacterium]